MNGGDTALAPPPIPTDHYPCDLCVRYRAKEPRNHGVRFVQGYWACEFCLQRYRITMRPGGINHAPRA